MRGSGHVGPCAAALLAAAAVPLRAETDTPVTLERVEGPIEDLEVFGEDGPFHVWTRDVVVTVRTVEGRPLTREETDEVRALALVCPPGGTVTNLAEGVAADGAYVASFTCEG